MTSREAVAKALTDHVFENDPEFDKYVDQFMESLKKSRFGIVELIGSIDVEGLYEESTP